MAECMADHVVSHHTAVPGAGKISQARGATRRLEDSFHAYIMRTSSRPTKSNLLWYLPQQNRTPILIGKSGASVTRIHRSDGSTWIEKRGSAPEISVEAAVVNWCASRLPVARVIAHSEGVLITSELAGANLTEVSPEDAVNVLAEALGLIHSVPMEDCPFSASWSLRVQQAEQRVAAGLVDEADFDDDNLGRSAADILAELKSLPPLPDLACFTHGDACLENFLSLGGRLSGIVDLGRAGIAHPAQDWALAVRSTVSNFGIEGEKMLRQHLPSYCSDEVLLRRFRLLDECF
jgi:aminoglycoside phosphotransferase